MKKIIYSAAVVFSSFGVLIGSFFSTTKPMADYSDTRKDAVIELVNSDGKIVRVQLSKPEGRKMNAVLLVSSPADHMGKRDAGGKEDENLSESKERYLKRGWLVLVFEEPPVSSRTDQEVVEEVLLAIDFLQKDIWRYNIALNRLIVQGNSLGATNALIACKHRRVDAVIATTPEIGPFSAPGLNGGSVSVSSFSKKVEIKQLKSPFLIVAGEQDTGGPVNPVLEMERDYYKCQRCIGGSQFLFYPGRPNDWNRDQVWEVIFDFVKG